MNAGGKAGKLTLHPIILIIGINTDSRPERQNCQRMKPGDTEHTPPQL